MSAQRKIVFRKVLHNFKVSPADDTSGTQLRHSVTLTLTAVTKLCWRKCLRVLTRCRYAALLCDRVTGCKWLLNDIPPTGSR